MDPFEVVAPAESARDRSWQRIQQVTCGHNRRPANPLYRIRRFQRTRAHLLTDLQNKRINREFAANEQAAVNVIRCMNQRIVEAYRFLHGAAAKEELAVVVTGPTDYVSPSLIEIIALARNPKYRAADEVSCFVRSGTSNAPTVAINGWPKHLRGVALGFRNLTPYMMRSLLGIGSIYPCCTLNRKGTRRVGAVVVPLPFPPSQARARLGSIAPVP